MNSGKKFDVVLMNPPYDNKLHEKFLMKVFEISKEGISIQPAVFMNKGNRYRKSFKNIINACKKHLTDVEIINKNDIDHIDRNRQNNRVTNLRCCNRSENMRNKNTLKQLCKSFNTPEYKQFQRDNNLGRRWINNGEIRKKLFQHDCIKYLENGWKYGWKL